jgi:hypothetical protein
LRLLLDTTYLLPAIGIAVKSLPEDAPIRLIGQGHQISVCDATVFELAATGGKYTVTGALAPERVARGIRSVVYDERIAKIPLHDSSVLLTAFRLRRMLSDFIDCLILSSAINWSDILLTEDEHINNLKENRDFQGLLETLNPEFKIQTMAGIL